MAEADYAAGNTVSGDESFDSTRTGGLVTLPSALVGVLLATGLATQAGAVQILVPLLAQIAAVTTTIEHIARGHIAPQHAGATRPARRHCPPTQQRTLATPLQITLLPTLKTYLQPLVDNSAADSSIRYRLARHCSTSMATPADTAQASHCRWTPGSRSDGASDATFRSAGSCVWTAGCASLGENGRKFSRPHSAFENAPISTNFWTPRPPRFVCRNSVGSPRTGGPPGFIRHAYQLAARMRAKIDRSIVDAVGSDMCP